jgi:hypothetical protein
MTEEYKPRGALFVNRKRNPETNQPHYNGDLEIDKEILADLNAQAATGISRPKIRLSGWSKEGVNAGKYISIGPSIMEEKPKQAPQNSANAENRARPTPPPAPQESNDEIPF